MKHLKKFNENIEEDKCLNCGGFLYHEGSRGRDTETMGGLSVEYLKCSECDQHHEKIERSSWEDDGLSMCDEPEYPED